MTIDRADGLGVWDNAGIDNFKREKKESMFLFSVLYLITSIYNYCFLWFRH